MEALFNLFAKKMKGVVLRYARTTFDIDDIVQEGFIRLFNSIDSYNFEGSFEGWVKRIFINTAINYYRKNLREQQNIPLEETNVNDKEAAVIADHLSYEELLNLINQLPDGYKFVFNMFAIEGYSHKEIAETLGITESTSSSQYLRAKKHLVKLLTIQQMV